MQVTNSSNVSDPEIIRQSKIRQYENNDLFVIFVSVFKSVNPALWLKEEVYNEPVVATIYVMSSKENSYLEALQQLGIAHNTPAKISYFNTTPSPSDTFH